MFVDRPQDLAPPSALRGAWRRRGAFLAVMLAAGVFGAVWTSPIAARAAVSVAGPELTRVMRGMAALKMLFVGGAAAGVFWRLEAPVRPPRLALYAGCGAAMAAGPCLIWDMAHVRVGAALLHGGLLATVVLLWRDPASARLLSDWIARRRAALRAQASF